MMRKLGLVACALGLATADKYIVQYDQDVWSHALKFSANSKDTVRVLKELNMVIVDIAEGQVGLYEALPGATVFKDEPVHMYDAPSVSFVEENPPSWGLDRLDQKQLPLDQKYHYSQLASDVNVFVVDTGVNAEHNEFGGRATFSKNFAGDGQDTDCNGHGTHVSSTIGGTTVGIAKGAKVIGVKVLTCSGSGTLAGVVSGIDHVVKLHRESSNKKSVINMSLGGGKNVALNAAVEAAWLAGVTTVVAAGNSADDACRYSPASAPSIISVAASDINDGSAYFTNYGKCTTLYAPGVNIKGAWIGGKDKFNTISGTSMASPHVAGVAAILLGSGEASTPAEVKAALVKNGTPGVVKNVKADTPNILLYQDPKTDNKINL